MSMRIKDECLSFKLHWLSEKKMDTWNIVYDSNKHILKQEWDVIVLFLHHVLLENNPGSNDTIRKRFKYEM